MRDLFEMPIFRDRTLTRGDLESRVGAPLTLIDCDLEDADLSELDCAGWRFERCNLRRAMLDGAELERTHWQSCRGAFASFVGANLSEASLVACDFNNAVLRRCTLEGARIERSKLTGADLSEAKALNLNLEETLLIGSRFTARSFRRMALKRLDFS